MNAPRRVVVVLGPGSAEIEATLRKLGLSPLNDIEAEATIWVTPEPRSLDVGEPAGEAAPGGESPLLLTMAQAARALGVGRSTVYEMVARGELEVVHIGRAARVPAAAVTQFVEAIRDATQLSRKSVPRSAKLQDAGTGISQLRRLPSVSV